MEEDHPRRLLLQAARGCQQSRTAATAQPSPSETVRPPTRARKTEPLALKDKPKPVIKKPKIFDPPRRPPLIIDPPPRVKPRKNKEILQILDDLEDDAQPKRPKKAPPPPTQLAIRKKLRVLPA